jgi:hypothetical protein
MRLQVVELVVALGFFLPGILLGCTPAASPSPPPNPPAEADVPRAARTCWSGTYTRDIQPIFDQYCIACHGPSRAENGLRLDSYQNTLRGTQHGPVVVPGSPGTSTLASVIQGTAAPQVSMPHEGRKLTANRIQNIILWIEAGAPGG